MLLPVFIQLAISSTLVLAQFDSGSGFKCPHQTALELSLQTHVQKLDFSSIFEKQMPERLNPVWKHPVPGTIDLEEYGIIQRDNLLAPSVVTSFAEHIRRLEGDLSWDKHRWDQYPSHKLLNLVDNGLYPYTSGVTRMMSDGRLSVARLDLDPSRNMDPEYSSRYQMLPTDVVINPHTGDLELKSYINNLHPGTYQELYHDLRSILAFIFPLFERSLGLVSRTGPAPVTLAGRSLQLVFNIKSVHVNTQYSMFPGSQWHTEGLDNEHIIATAIYYYDIQNITQTDLQFKLELPKGFAPAATANLSASATEFVQLGHVHCKTGRIVVFPNTYHHRVETYRLLSEANTGHRKVLVLFLLDPTWQIPSTSAVPPQQMDWYTDAKEYGAVGNVSGAYDIGQALQYREGFHDERSERKCCGGGRRD